MVPARMVCFSFSGAGVITAARRDHHNRILEHPTYSQVVLTSGHLCHDFRADSRFGHVPSASAGRNVNLLQGAGCRVQDLWFRAQGPGCRVPDARFGALGLGVKVPARDTP